MSIPFDYEQARNNYSTHTWKNYWGNSWSHVCGSQGWSKTASSIEQGMRDAWKGEHVIYYCLSKSRSTAFNKAREIQEQLNKELGPPHRNASFEIIS